MRHHTIIYNPASALGTARARIPDIEQLLTEKGLAYDLVFTEGPGHATEIAESAARSESTDVIVAAGGDGTANEVINGLMRVRDDDSAGHGGQTHLPALAVMAIGRGNDFAYGCHIPTDAEACADVLKAGHEETLDIGLLVGGDFPDGRYFGNGIGVGFDTIVSLEAAKLRRLQGFPGYLVAALKTLVFYYVIPRLELRIDSEESTQECIQVSVMNGQRLGGGFYMAPEAITNDGVFHWCIAGKPRRLQMLGLLLKYMKGRQAESAHVTTGTSRTFSIRAIEGTMAVHADGETMCAAGTEISFECIPNALRVVTRAPEER